LAAEAETAEAERFPVQVRVELLRDDDLPGRAGRRFVLEIDGVRQQLVVGDEVRVAEAGRANQVV